MRRRALTALVAMGAVLLLPAASACSMSGADPPHVRATTIVLSDEVGVIAHRTYEQAIADFSVQPAISAQAGEVWVAHQGRADRFDWRVPWNRGP